MYTKHSSATVPPLKDLEELAASLVPVAFDAGAFRELDLQSTKLRLALAKPSPLRALWLYAVNTSLVSDLSSIHMGVADKANGGHRKGAPLYRWPEYIELAACELLVRLLEREADRLEGVKRPGGKLKKRGRPSDTDKQGDRRIAEAWESGQYTSQRQLANDFEMSLGEVKRARDRHRKRQEH